MRPGSIIYDVNILIRKDQAIKVLMDEKARYQNECSELKEALSDCLKLHGIPHSGTCFDVARELLTRLDNETRAKLGAKS